MRDAQEEWVQSQLDRDMVRILTPKNNVLSISATLYEVCHLWHGRYSSWGVGVEDFYALAGEVSQRTTLLTHWLNAAYISGAGSDVAERSFWRVVVFGNLWKYVNVEVDMGDPIRQAGLVTSNWVGVDEWGLQK